MYFHSQMYTWLYSNSSPLISIFNFLVLVADIYTAMIGLWLAVSHLYVYYERILIIESCIKRLRLSYIESLSVNTVISNLSILLLIYLFSLFRIVNSINFCSFCYLYARSPLNFSVCLSKGTFFIFIRAWLSSISNM